MSYGQAAYQAQQPYGSQPQYGHQQQTPYGHQQQQHHLQPQHPHPHPHLQQQPQPHYQHHPQPHQPQYQHGQQPPQQFGYHAAPPSQGPPAHNASGRPPKRQKGNPVITRYPPPPGYRPPPSAQPSLGQSQYPGGQQSYQQPAWQPPSQAYQPPNSHAVYQQQHPPQPQPWQPPQQQGGYPPQPSHQHAPNQGYSGAPNYQQQPYQQQPHQQQYPPQGYQAQPGYQQPPQQQRWQQTRRYPSAGNHYLQHQPSPDQNQPRPHQWQASPPQQSAYPHSDVSPGAPRRFDTPPRRAPYIKSARGSATPTTAPPPPVAGVKRPSSAMSMGSDNEAVKAGASADPNDPLNLNAEEWDYDGDGALWPKTNELIEPSLSIGIIIWHPANPVTRALASSFDEAEEAARKPMPEPYGNGESVSKYCTLENNHDAFLDVRSLDHWERVKDDPIFVEFPEEYELVPLEEVVKVRDRPDVEDEEILHPKDDHKGATKPEEPVSAPLSATKSLPIHPSSGKWAPVKAFPVDDGQEDILAKLGVSGLPKPVYPTPGPAYAPPSMDGNISPIKTSPRSAHPMPHHGNQGSPPIKQDRRSSHHGYGPPPPPDYGPEEWRPRSPDVWTTNQPTNGRHSPARSDNSNHTMTGSDFGGADTTGGATEGGARDAWSAGGSLKRTYDQSEDRDQSDGNEKLRQTDDSTPRGKRKKAQVASAYSRR